MWLQKSGGDEDKNDQVGGLLAVAIDKDKGSQHALKWAIDHLLKKGHTILLVHVRAKSTSSSLPATPVGNRGAGVAILKGHQIDQQTRDLLLPFRCFCTRKDIQCCDIVLEDSDIAKALIEYVSHAAIENLVLGAPAKNGLFRRFKAADVPSTVYKGAPDFCTVYIINKNKISQVRSASRPAPSSAIRNQIQSQANSVRSEPGDTQLPPNHTTRSFEMPSSESRNSVSDMDFIKSPFTRGSRAATEKSFCSEPPMSDTDISFVSSGRPSVDRLFPSFYDGLDSGRTSRVSNSSDVDLRSFESAIKSPELSFTNDYSYASQDSGDSQCAEDVEAEMRRLKLELKQTMDMYSTACKEALTAKQKAMELHRWKMEEEQRLEEARLAEEAALSMAENEKAKAKAALEAADAARRIAQMEAQKRRDAEMRALKESQEKTTVLNTLANKDVRYRKYLIDEIEVATEYFAEARKIGEGGYGPVYKGYLDHTAVAIKVLRPDAAQGRSQFQQEIEVLSCIRHPNMVLLLGACPEYGCLVYEYMANGSLDDRLFRRGNTPVLSWQLRFRISAEIGTGLLFLHQTKPEPIVHRDLKPGNILLDRNFVSKISDVGLARLVPPSVADSVTQYRMTSTAGTFCYIDPEYQQTGMLGIKSDVYSLGIMFLQIITAKSPMGLAHHVAHAIEKGTFSEMLDPEVPDWPVEEALLFAKLALRCAELRRKDRPDLGKELMPELNKLRILAEENMPTTPFGSMGGSPRFSNASMGQDVMSDPQLGQSGCSSKSRLSGSPLPDRRSIQ